MDILRSIVTYESSLGHQWRRRVVLLEQSLCFPSVFALHLTAIQDKFIPILFTNLHQVHSSSLPPIPSYIIPLLLLRSLLLSVHHLMRLIDDSFMVYVDNKQGVMPVKLACARSLVGVLRSQPLAHKRMELCTRIIREFGQAKSYWDRMLFIDICIGNHNLTSSTP
jgi:hypothetical protein